MLPFRKTLEHHCHLILLVKRKCRAESRGKHRKCQFWIFFLNFVSGSLVGGCQRGGIFHLYLKMGGTGDIFCNRGNFNLTWVSPGKYARHDLKESSV